MRDLCSLWSYHATHKSFPPYYLSLPQSMKCTMGGAKFNYGSIPDSLPSPRTQFKNVMKKLSKSNGHNETSYGNSTEDMHDLHKTRDGIADTLDLPGVLFSDTGSVYSIETKIDHKTSTTHGLKKKGHQWTILTPTIPTKAMSDNENLEVIDNFRVVKFRSWDSALSNDCISSSYDRSISCDTGDLDNICDISSSVTVSYTHLTLPTKA